MRRRPFALGSVAALALSAAPGIAQTRTARLGVLSSATDARTPGGPHDSLLQALAAAGWIEGRNLAIDWRFADGDLERHAPLAAELVALKPDVILAATQPSALAVAKVTKTVPIVFALVQDPVSAGLADSLARPGRNATGLASMNTELLGKRIELLLQAVPTARRIAVLHQPDFDLNAKQAALAEQVLRSLSVTALRVAIGRPETFDASFEALARERPDAVLVIENPSIFANRADIARRMAASRLPAMYGWQLFALDGGLMSYSIDFVDQYRRAAGYVDRILRGAKPGELPIEQPMKFELTVNLKAGKALGLTFPPTILMRAERVIE